jgi:hypothetical protein
LEEDRAGVGLIGPARARSRICSGLKTPQDIGSYDLSDLEDHYETRLREVSAHVSLSLTPTSNTEMSDWAHPNRRQN